MNFVTIALIYVFISLILCEITSRGAYESAFFNWIHESVETKYNSNGKTCRIMIEILVGIIIVLLVPIKLVFSAFELLFK